MLTATETPRDLRKKLSRVTSSHKSLKDKLREKQYELKKLKNCLSAMQASRDKWRLECKESELLTNNLRQELSNVTQDRDKIIAEIENNKSMVLKKMT